MLKIIKNKIKWREKRLTYAINYCQLVVEHIFPKDSTQKRHRNDQQRLKFAIRKREKPISKFLWCAFLRSFVPKLLKKNFDNL